MRTVIVCGSRDWHDSVTIRHELGKLRREHGELMVVEGGARGADRCAGLWARNTPGVEWVQVQAEWSEHDPDWCPGPWCLNSGRHFCMAAGARRNQAMLDFALAQDAEVELIAFKENFDLSRGRGGTEDMVKRASAAGVSIQVHHGS